MVYAIKNYSQPRMINFRAAAKKLLLAVASMVQPHLETILHSCSADTRKAPIILGFRICTVLMTAVFLLHHLAPSVCTASEVIATCCVFGFAAVLAVEKLSE